MVSAYILLKQGWLKPMLGKQISLAICICALVSIIMSADQKESYHMSCTQHETLKCNFMTDMSLVVC